jgi:prepilin-type N-terminal cleavage/methylation domain-containing protein
MRQATHSTKGFTLIELMITVTIVAILAAIAIPSYLNYTRRAYYSEIVMATSAAKLGVTECYQTLGTLTGCVGGSNNVPANIATATGAVASLTTAGAGVITVVPVAARGIVATDTFVLTPTVTGNTLVWTTSGGGVTNGYTQ